MRTKVIVILLISNLSISFKSHNSGDYFECWKEWDDNVLIMANSAGKARGMTNLEKDVVFFINLARMNGPLFERTFLKACVKNEHLRSSQSLRTLRKKLQIQPRMLPLKTNRDLLREADKHASDMGRSGKKGHRSSDGLFFFERVRDLTARFEKVKECNEYGDTKPMVIVVYLMIDEASRSERRRRMILDPDMRYVGVGTAYHKKFGYNTTFLFASKEIEKDSTAL